MHNMTVDPGVMSAEMPSRPDGGSSLILGLDLGTSTGYAFAYHTPGTPVVPTKLTAWMGQWDLSAGPYDSGAIRFVRLRQFLAAVKPAAVFYEMVRNTPGEIGKITKYNAAGILARAITAAQLFGALQSHLCEWCEERDIPCTSFSIQAIKKRATGKGNANKVDMINAANKTFGADLDPEGYESTGVDNIADAAWCLLLGLENYAAGIKPGAHKED